MDNDNSDRRRISDLDSIYCGCLESYAKHSPETVCESEHRAVEQLRILTERVERFREALRQAQIKFGESE